MKMFQQCALRAEYVLISVLTGKFERGGKAKNTTDLLPTLASVVERDCFFCSKIPLSFPYSKNTDAF